MKTLFFTLMAAAALVLPALAAEDYFSKISIGTYGTVNWQKLAGRAVTGVGIEAEAPLYKNLSLRLSGEGDRWQPNDYFIDRGWVDLIGYIPLNAEVSFYGVAGFGYDLGNPKVVEVLGRHERGHSFSSTRDGEAVKAHAGGGLRAHLLKLGSVQVDGFIQGTLWASTTDNHGAGVLAGFSIGGK